MRTRGSIGCSPVPVWLMLPPRAPEPLRGAHQHQPRPVPVLFQLSSREGTLTLAKVARYHAAPYGKPKQQHVRETEEGAGAQGEAAAEGGAARPAQAGARSEAGGRPARRDRAGPPAPGRRRVTAAPPPP